jgi:N-acetylglutamate synthase
MIYEVLEGTWPAAAVHRVGPWTIREGQGGGSRVSAATANAVVTAGDLLTAEQAMTALGQPPLFMIRDTDDALDVLLTDVGYQIKDPVLAYAAPVTNLAAHGLPPKTAFQAWPPLAIQAEIWATGSIGPERLAIMDRVLRPKASFLGRMQDQPAGCVFVACHGTQAMVHALEILPPFRCQGLARHLLIAAARWAQGQGMLELSLVVTRANVAANALYASLGMGVVGQYHYRIRP